MGVNSLPDSVAAAIWTQALLHLVQHANRSASEPPKNTTTQLKLPTLNTD